MTKKQFKDIETKLAKWREDRGLKVEDQKLNFKKNYTEELLEFFQAKLKGDELEMIDAICDMVVVAINAGFSLSSFWVQGMSRVENEVMLLAYDPAEYKIGIQPLCNLLRFYDYEPYKCLLETIKELESRTGYWNEQKGKWIKDLGAYTLKEAKKKADGHYLIRNALLIAEDEGHWVFSRYPNRKIPIKKWYKADYSECKL